MADKNEKAKFEWGFTKMYHAVKKHFGLSDAEYIYMDMIANLAPQHGGWTHISNATSAEALGYSARAIDGYNKKLKAAGLLETKEFENGDRVGKRGTAFWWECINNVKVEIPTAKNAPPTAKDAHPCANSAHPYAKDAPPPAKDAHYTISNNISNTLDNDFSKEKSTAVFSEKNSESETQPLPQTTEPEKKEKEKKVAAKKEKDETPDENSQSEDFVALGSLPAYVPMETLKLKGVSLEVWAGFIQSVTRRLGKKRLKRNLFEQWVKKLFNAVNVIPDQIILEHFVEYECKTTWTTPFFSNYLDKLQKDCKSANLPLKNNQSTNQQTNNQNGTTQSNNQPRFNQQDVANFAKQYQQSADF